MARFSQNSMLCLNALMVMYWPPSCLSHIATCILGLALASIIVLRANMSPDGPPVPSASCTSCSSVEITSQHSACPLTNTSTCMCVCTYTAACTLSACTFRFSCQRASATSQPCMLSCWTAAQGWCIHATPHACACTYVCTVQHHILWYYLHHYNQRVWWL